MTSVVDMPTGEERKKKLTNAEEKRAEQRIERNYLLGVIETADIGSLSINDWLEGEEILARASALPAVYDNEIVDAIAHRFKLNPWDKKDYKTSIAQYRREGTSKTRKSRPPIAKSTDYFQLFEQTLGDIRHDLLSGRLLYKNRAGLWVSVLNAKRLLSARAAMLEEEEVLRYDRSLIDAYLAEYQERKEPDFVIDVPPWDGVDRIADMAGCVRVAAPFGPDDFRELLSEWLMRCYRRIYQPKTQNRILILKGEQERGKDTWIDTLTGGFGQFASHLNVSSGDKDVYLQLHYSVVLKVSEFDRTAKWEASLLKDLITRPDTNLRAPYDPDPQFRFCRCSFISSCNIEDIVKDHTGARRFLIFDVEGIDWTYDQSEAHSLQILSQAKDLHERDYKASDAAWAKVKESLEPRIPDNPEDIVEDVWRELVAGHMETLKHDRPAVYSLVRGRGYLSNTEAAPLFEQVAKISGMSIKQCRGVLKRRGHSHRTKKTRGYALPEGVVTRGDTTDEGFETPVF